FAEWEVALRRPVPRIAEGMALAARGLAAGDVSDGLVREMEKFAAASGAGCRIDLEAVPRAEGVGAEDAVASGEETELVCAGPRELVEAAAAELECGLTVVGEMTASPAVAVLDARGREVALPRRGHEHFR
ncbi:MAG: AIR synthase-related protein, partial [Candidatus Dormibacterales bacterium]